MKKLLMSAIVLFLFSLSFLIIQTSCSKTNAQQNTTSVTQLNKIVYSLNYGTPNLQIWTANFDGTNPTQVPLVLPANIKIDTNANYYSLRISPDGQTIFFTAYDTSIPTYSPSIYSCNISGSNVTEVIQSSTGGPIIGAAY